MPTRRTPLLLVVAILALARLLPAEEPEEKRSFAAREGIEAIEVQLGRAVDRVSLPHAARLLGRVESARGYRLPGYGLVLVLTPRMLPGGQGQVYVLRGGAPKEGRVRVESRRPATAEAEWTVDEGQIEALERQVLVLQHETEAARRAAEADMERIVQDVRVRVATPLPPAPAEAPLPPPPPPWKFWFEAGTPEEKRTPEALVADVRGAVIEVLAAQGERIVGLARDERVAVTVDFVPGGLFAAQARAEKTLVVTARVKDVAARARGAITPEEFRRRVEVTEY